MPIRSTRSGNAGHRTLCNILILALVLALTACSDDAVGGSDNSADEQNGYEQDVREDDAADDTTDNGDNEDNQYEPTGNPVADAGPDKSALVGETVYFNASFSFHQDPNVDIVNYEWKFMDIGLTSEGFEVSRSYQEEGSFIVTLTVTDEYGMSDTDALLVEVATLDNVNGGNNNNGGNPGTGGKAQDGDFDSEDEWIMYPYDTDGSTTTTCGMSQVILEPRTCTIEIEAPYITKYCNHMGGDDVYVGEITGENTFYLELERRDQPSDFCPTGFHFTEYIEAEFVSSDRWEGTSEMGVVYNDAECAALSCTVPIHPITGERD